MVHRKKRIHINLVYEALYDVVFYGARVVLVVVSRDGLIGVVEHTFLQWVEKSCMVWVRVAAINFLKNLGRQDTDLFGTVT